MDPAIMLWINGLEYKEYPLVIRSPNQTEIVFSMGKNACLKGPLAIYNTDGHLAFRLEEGVWYPTKCGKNRK